MLQALAAGAAEAGEGAAETRPRAVEAAEAAEAAEAVEAVEAAEQEQEQEQEAAAAVAAVNLVVGGTAIAIAIARRAAKGAEGEEVGVAGEKRQVGVARHSTTTISERASAQHVGTERDGSEMGSPIDCLYSVYSLLVAAAMRQVVQTPSAELQVRGRGSRWRVLSTLEAQWCDSRRALMSCSTTGLPRRTY
eukprot:COSAG06_NODE_6_length_38168_cov_131.592398_16_plen_192_part_00